MSTSPEHITVMKGYDLNGAIVWDARRAQQRPDSDYIEWWSSGHNYTGILTHLGKTHREALRNVLQFWLSGNMTDAFDVITDSNVAVDRVFVGRLIPDELTDLALRKICGRD